MLAVYASLAKNLGQMNLFRTMKWVNSLRNSKTSAQVDEGFQQVRGGMIYEKAGKEA
jgi:hypothetical protein